MAQAAPKINTLRIEITTPGSTESQVYMFNKGGEPTYPPSAYQPVSSGTKNYVEIKWNNIRGLEVFDPNTKSKVFIHAGDVPLIIMKRERGICGLLTKQILDWKIPIKQNFVPIKIKY